MSVTLEAARESTLAEWAIRYMRFGLSVVPMHTVVDGECTCGRRDCPSPAKHPRVRWEPLTEAPADERQITTWWKRWPAANVGIVTGSVSDLAVLDVDPRANGGVSLERLEKHWGRLPRTPTVRTGGSGRHFWFRHAGGKLASTELADGVELKGSRAIVVAPPSLHATGMRYRWLPGLGLHELELAQLPEWLGELTLPEREHRKQPGEPLARTREEQREFTDAWTRAGIELRDGDDYYRCPFHPDSHPSLHIDSERCRWYCFGCRRGGGMGRLLRLLGDEPPRRRRARLHGRIGSEHEITLPGNQRVDVVGESRHQDDLLELTGGTRRYGGVRIDAVAELVPEPDNPADPHAIGVHIEGRPVGYLGRAEAARRHDAVEATRRDAGTATCLAVIGGGWDRGGGDIGSFGVVVFLPDER